MKNKLNKKFRRDFFSFENDHTVVYLADDIKVIYFKKSGNLKAHDHRPTGKYNKNEVDPVERVNESYYFTI